MVGRACVPSRNADEEYMRGKEGGKPSVLTLVDRGGSQRYVVPAKSADETTITRRSRRPSILTRFAPTIRSTITRASIENQ
jgi:hypothetical protein